ncbi:MULTISPECIES: hypothetical protein [unclassified Microbacterium]|uniref:hypothetical protein n=1 Tax=unclassified Microbacterium TaxID=2609290 RepID=UPI00386815B9
MLSWLATGVAVLAIVVVLAEPAGALSDAARLALGLCLGVGTLVLVVTPVVYVIARARNRRSTTAGGPLPDAPRSRAVQRAAGSLLARGGAFAPPDDTVRRIVLTDRVQLTAAALADIDDRRDALSFIWAVRPSQPSGFGDSAQFRTLPPWAQDAVILLDLRRDIQVRGADAAFRSAPGFYAQPFDRIVDAARRTANTELEGALERARQAVVAPAGTTTTGPHDATIAVQRVRDLLDDEDVWARVLAGAN